MKASLSCRGTKTVLNDQKDRLSRLLWSLIVLGLSNAWTTNLHHFTHYQESQPKRGPSRRRTRTFSSSTASESGLPPTQKQHNQANSALSLTLDELSKALGGRGRAQACWECFRLGMDPIWYYYTTTTRQDSVAPPRLLDLPVVSRNDVTPLLSSSHRILGREALQRLQRSFSAVESTVALLVDRKTSQDGTTKLLLQLQDDGLQVECVLLPWSNRNGSTLCVSSQVGCRQACRFCATGTMGLRRSLSVDEILAQVYWANKLVTYSQIQSEHDNTSTLPNTFLYPVDNVVFMGMGEPADNADAVVRAVHILTDRNLFRMAPRRVAVSTVAPSLDSFSKLLRAPAVLAWSVHSSRNDVRKRLVPTTKYSMVQLRQALLQAVQEKFSKRRNKVMLEVCLLQDVNDSTKDALHLAEFCRPLLEARMQLVINLIPWNDITSSTSLSSAIGTFQSPSRERVLGFQQVLVQQGLLCFVRTTRGDDESAACGQLATKTTTKRRGPHPSRPPPGARTADGKQ